MGSGEEGGRDGGMEGRRVRRREGGMEGRRARRREGEEEGGEEEEEGRRREGGRVDRSVHAIIAPTRNTWSRPWS